MWDNQVRYQTPSYGIALTTPEWSDFAATNRDLISRTLMRAWQANSDDEARRIWSEFLKEWDAAGSTKASDSVAKVLRQLYG